MVKSEQDQIFQEEDLLVAGDRWTDSIDDISFWSPEELVESAWHEHAPFVFWLIEALKPRIFVELGTHNGFSYFAACQAVKRLGLPTLCHAIDSWVGDIHAGQYGEEVYERVSAINAEKYSKFSKLNRCTFDEAIEFFDDKSIDLMHIDGRHLYEDVTHDFAAWLPKMSDRGIVLFHDTRVQERSFGVWRFWDELTKRYPSFEFLHGHGLGVLAVGECIPSGIASIMNANVSAATSIRAAYSHLGRSVSLQWDSTITTRKVETLTAQIDAERSERVSLASELVSLASERDILVSERGVLVSERAALASERDALASEKAALEDEYNQSLNKITILYKENTDLRSIINNTASILAVINENQSAATDKIEREITQLRDKYQSSKISSRRLEAIESSESWRITAPLRAMGIAAPALARLTRRAVKLAWWTLTLQLHTRLNAYWKRSGIRIDEAIFRKLARFGLKESPLVVGNLVRRSRASPEPKPRLDNVDIVICVHNAIDDVKRCLESIIQHTLPPYSIIIVDDGSSAPTRTYLDEFVFAHGATLVRHEVAKGYTFAANAGLRASSAPFVVLLNSDTEVTGAWLDRMVDCSLADEKLGIVGPLSNCASWQSVPELFVNGDWADNELPANYSANAMARIVSDISLRNGIQVGFVNGFCMLIRRSTLDDVGLFDEKTFGAGYGEENDFCIRARKKGWKLAIADDAYVFHHQSRSYGHDRRLALARNADEALLKKHDSEKFIQPYVAQLRDNIRLHHTRLRIRASLVQDEIAHKGMGLFQGKRIAFVLPVAEAGGGSNVVIQEAVAARKFGVDTWIINVNDLEPGFTRDYGHLDIPMIAIDRHNPSAGIAAAAHEFKFDAILATVYHSVYWLPLLDDLPPQTRLGYYIQDLETLFFDLDDAQYAVARDSYFTRPDIKRITKSSWNRAAVVGLGGIAPDCIGFSVDLAHFAPATDGGLDGPRAVHVVAMIRPSTPRRGPQITLTVLNELKGEFGERVIVSCFGASAAEIATLNIPIQDVHCYGHLKPDQVSELLGNADVFLDFSVWQAMGLTVLEAMASGAAVVVPVKGGASEFCRHEVSALVVDTQDKSACHRAARRLVNDAGLRMRLRREGMRVANSHPPEIAAYNLLCKVLG